MEWRAEGRLDAAGRRRDQAAADRAQCDSKRSAEERRVRGEAGCSGARGAFYSAGEGGGGSRSEELDGGRGVHFKVDRFKE
jgi:hypothetical protein